MALLFQKFQEFVKTLAKSPTFARNPRTIQLEADMNRLFLYTSYNRLGRNATETDAEEIIDMASKAALADQEKQVQENIHSQIKTLCTLLDKILVPTFKNTDEPLSSSPHRNDTPRRSGLSFAVGRDGQPPNQPAVPETKALSRSELSQYLKELSGYSLDIKPSQIPHKEAGQGLFVDGEAGVGAVVAFYPGVTYSPAYYRYIPGYPRVDASNPYLITRYDGIVINAQPWGTGGGTRELWNGLTMPEIESNVPTGSDRGSDRMWKLLSKPLQGDRRNNGGEVLERRNPLALGHFANHPGKEMEPNVMVCPYDFPLTDMGMRAYIPNISFGSDEPAKMKRFGSFWFKSGGSGEDISDVPVLKTLVLIATRAICNEEVLLNYRLSNSKRRPAWYTPVDAEEDRRRWS
ncbi:C5orf35 [Thalictrum thalictroides]|uniref:C5orf35 n=1 Tax=Thalictrum thalictroides TaxID=46969 RepID=A0A7J6W796_THATH|nr:C5orf35 [Thalictrum thalictroides]